jgi:hypothetical protein
VAYQILLFFITLSIPPAVSDTVVDPDNFDADPDPNVT